MSDITLRLGPAFEVEGIADHVAEVIARPGERTIAVPGGSTPFPIFDALAKRDLDWSQTTIFLTDDRVVDPDHEASNFGRLRTSLGSSGARIMPLEEGIEAPAFDLVWLGMGADGHVASLFPNTDPTTSVSAGVVRLTPDPLPPEAPFDRLSWTLLALLNTNATMLVIRGKDKLAVLFDALLGKNDLPIARLLAASTAPVTIFGSDQ